MSTITHVIEVNSITAGIIVGIKGGFRFFAAERAFKSLDLAVFSSIEDANRAARAKLAKRQSREPGSVSPTVSSVGRA